jgi:phytanoyl-CoA hydroxylase
MGSTTTLTQTCSCRSSFDRPAFLSMTIRAQIKPSVYSRGAAIRSSRAPKRPCVTHATHRRSGTSYKVTQDEIEHFHREGWVHLKGVLSEEEISKLETSYSDFINGKLCDLSKLGKDFCDMSGSYDKDLSKFSIINIMLPSTYHPPLKHTLYEQRAASIASQLYKGADMVVDYDQLLAKPPEKPDAVFAWHQDLHYWPLTKDTRTASFWLAIDDVSEENGCIRFVPGSHKEEKLRECRPLLGDRSKSHVLVAEVREGDKIAPAIINRGDLTVHNERIVHGSGGNYSKTSWRRAWVIAFRTRETVEEERRLGFTHSHNDDLKVLNEVGKEK